MNYLWDDLTDESARTKTLAASSESFSAEVSNGHSENYVFSLSEKIFPGTKYPKTVCFTFEKRRTGRQLCFFGCRCVS